MRWQDLATHEEIVKLFKRIEDEFAYLKDIDPRSDSYFKSRRKLLTLKIIGLRNNQIIKADLDKFQS